MGEGEVWGLVKEGGLGRGVTHFHGGLSFIARISSGFRDTSISIRVNLLSK